MIAPPCSAEVGSIVNLSVFLARRWPISLAQLHVFGDRASLYCPGVGRIQSTVRPVLLTLSAVDRCMSAASGLMTFDAYLTGEFIPVCEEENSLKIQKRERQLPHDSSHHVLSHHIPQHQKIHATIRSCHVASNQCETIFTRANKIWPRPETVSNRL